MSSQLDKLLVLLKKEVRSVIREEFDLLKEQLERDMNKLFESKIQSGENIQEVKKEINGKSRKVLDNYKDLLESRAIQESKQDNAVFGKYEDLFEDVKPFDAEPEVDDIPRDHTGIPLNPNKRAANKVFEAINRDYTGLMKAMNK